jgi:uncharacterized protein YlxW (UPF0749 family)
MTDSTRPAPDPDPAAHEGLLTQLMTNTLDQDYQAAADRRTESPRVTKGSHRLTAGVVVLVFGVMIGISALRTEQQKPLAEAERAELVEQIQARQHTLDRMHAQLAALEGLVATQQDTASSSRTLQRRTQTSLSTLAGLAGAAEVSGPGVQITTDDAPDARQSSTGGVIMDSDLQNLVNGLWTAGAEAIAINGHRLTSLTAIRFAGSAITVDYRSLTPPYVIDAIGNPDTLPARLLETPGGQAWQGLRANFGIRFDTLVVQDLVLPADPNVMLHKATPVGVR